jgi:hypothetical protein
LVLTIPWPLLLLLPLGRQTPWPLLLLLLLLCCPLQLIQQLLKLRHQAKNHPRILLHLVLLLLRVCALHYCLLSHILSPMLLLLILL